MPHEACSYTNTNKTIRIYTYKANKQKRKTEKRLTELNVVGLLLMNVGVVFAHMLLRALVNSLGFISNL